MDGAQLIYRIHRYIFTSEEYAKDEGEDVSAELKAICEWYNFMIKLSLSANGKSMPLAKLHCGFISKKAVKENDGVIDHVPSGGLKFLKSDKTISLLKVSKD